MSNKTHDRIANIGLIVGGCGCGLIFWNPTNLASVIIGIVLLAIGNVTVFRMTGKHK